MLKLLTLLCWMVLLASCYDAPRDNPLDPALTPAVELQVALDDTAGTATLTWSQYEGQQPFREYRVLRNEVERTRVDTLVHIPAVEQTNFVDSSLAPATAYEYRVTVVNAGGYEASSAGSTAHPLNLPPVRIARADFNSAAASASLAWTRYQGPRFKAYRVLRSTTELAAQVVQEKSDIADTSLVDPGLLGNTEYFYQVVVLTERGEEVKSEEQGNAFHRLVDTFPLEGRFRPFVRLYR
ncbi:MAG: fibronectin type III domain-containing protein [Candidatus Latescibacteria bacterium]|nr:fibronectin type III domain-containing protein [Candidatus Latescibacterota bacterium]